MTELIGILAKYVTWEVDFGLINCVISKVTFLKHDFLRVFVKMAYNTASCESHVSKCRFYNHEWS